MTNEVWTSIAQWASGITLVASGVFVTIWKVLKDAKAIGSENPKVQRTSIITGDTVAMDSLARTIEASNVILTENNILRREEHADRIEMRIAIVDNTEAIERATATVAEARIDIRDLSRDILRSGK